MIQLLKKYRAFRDDEKGLIALEFVVLFPVFLIFLMSAIELSMITVRQTMLDRGLDMTMREVRIGTEQNYTHDQVRDRICEGAVVFDDCNKLLRLEMIHSDPRDYTPLPNIVDCVVVLNEGEHDETLNPVREFTNGQANQFMIVRACILYEPSFPTSLMALVRQRDAAGRSALVAVSSFTQEPR
jgi:Flp pilus assembly protein TadG